MKKNSPYPATTKKRELKPNRLILLAMIGMLAGALACSHENGRNARATGMVDGEIVTIKAIVAGTIDILDFKEGDPVQKDKILVQVNQEKVENQLKELEITDKEIKINRDKLTKKMRLVQSSINYLKNQVERFRRLKKSNAIAGEKLEAMELQLLEAETNRFDLQKSLEALDVQQEKVINKNEYLRLLLADHVIKAPVNGIILEKFISRGETVMPGTTIADILDSSSLYVEIFIEGKEIGRLKLNQDVQILVDGQTTPLHGLVSFFGKKAEFSPKYIISEKEREALLYQVKIKVQDPQGILKVGMPVTVDFNQNNPASHEKSH